MSGDRWVHLLVGVGVLVGFLVVGRVGAKLDLFVGFALGLSSHLLWDIVDYGDVRWIQGGNADRMFLLANAVGLLGWAWWVRKRG